MAVPDFLAHFFVEIARKDMEAGREREARAPEKFEING